MFTKSDFISYFSEIEQFEKNMRDYYAEATRKVEDPEVLQIFEGLSKAEDVHAQMVDELRLMAIKSSV